MKLKVTTVRHAHYLGACSDCDFEFGLHSDSNSRDAVRHAIRRHVREAGHRVGLDKGSIVYYEPQELDFEIVRAG